MSYWKYETYHIGNIINIEAYWQLGQDQYWYLLSILYWLPQNLIQYLQFVLLSASFSVFY